TTICFCLPGSDSLANISRNFSIFSSHGQPNIALSHEALKKPDITGLRMSAATQAVRKAFQPPLSGGSFLVRRPTSVCQSIDCMSTLKPAASSCALATGARLVSTGRSVDCIRTTGVPSYPASCESCFALAAFWLSASDMPSSLASGVPQTKGALQTLNHFGSPIVALRNSSWPKATNTAWRILGLSNGLNSELKRKGDCR